MSKIDGIPDGWEFVRTGTVQPGEWSLCIFGDPEFCTTDNLRNKNYVIVRKIEPPKPVYVPWTFETCPVGCVVKRKDLLSFQWMITAKTDTSAGQSGNYYLYDRLFHEFTQLDGTPCGTIAEAT